MNFVLKSGPWEGADDLGDEILREMRPFAERKMKMAGLLLESEIKTTLSGPRSGRIYRVPGTDKAMYQASAPGEPPASLFGNLRNSIGHSDPEWVGYTVQCEVGPGLGTKPAGGVSDPADTYARRLEYGGDSIHSNGAVVKILPRPYMEPSAQRATPRIEALFEDI